MNLKSIPADYQADFLKDIARFYNGDETFLPIPGHPGYLISDFGRILSMVRGKPHFMSPYRHTQGYALIQLRGPTGNTSHLVHRLVMLAHKGEPPVGDDGRRMLVCHENGIEWDCRLANLRYDTQAGNMSDKAKHGTLYASRNPRRYMNIDEATVRTILITACAMSIPAQCDMVGLPYDAVRKIRSGQNYHYLAPELPRMSRTRISRKAA